MGLKKIETNKNGMIEFYKKDILKAFAEYHFTDVQTIQDKYMSEFYEKIFNLGFEEKDDKILEISEYDFNRMIVFDKPFSTYIENESGMFIRNIMIL